MVINTAFPLAGAATTLETINGVAPTAGAVPVNSDTTPTLAGGIERALSASPAEVVRIYRSGGNVPAANFTATVSGTRWSFTSAALTQGTYTFVARIERSGDPGVFGQPSESINDPIDLTPPTVTITATSSVPPNAFVKGAVPESDRIVGQTNDPTPTVTVQVSEALGPSPSLVIQRNGQQINPRLDSCGTNCFRFVDNPGVKIALPPETPSNLPIANSYAVQALDAAGNRGEGKLTANFDYFICDQLRANAASEGGKHQSITSPNTACERCHGTVTDKGPPTVTFVAVPSSKATYWCRRPG